jgi:hypothetical protein
MWFVQARAAKELYHNFFIAQIRDKLKSHLAEQTLLSTPMATEKEKLDGNSEDYKDLFQTGLQAWDLTNFEEGMGTNPSDYLPCTNKNMSFIWHALTTHCAFDLEEYNKKKKFALHLSTQPAVNNRDFNPDRAKPKENTNEPSLYCFVTNKPNSKKTKNDKILNGDGHFILCKRIRRELVEDNYLKENLAPYTHMNKIFEIGDSSVSREKGQKLLGDPVAVGCTFEDMNSLFKVLTVRNNFGRKELRIIFECDAILENNSDPCNGKIILGKRLPGGVRVHRIPCLSN